MTPSYGRVVTKPVVEKKKKLVGLWELFWHYQQDQYLSEIYALTSEY